MSYYQFNPDFSFLARLYWQPDRNDPAQFQRIGAVRNGDAPWASDGWLHAGRDDFTNRAVADYIVSRRKFATQFWFGCYETDGEFDYEIRAAGVDDRHPHWNYANRRLDVSRNGYLGLYAASEAPGHDPLASLSRLWRVDGLPGGELSAGAGHAGLRLLGAQGQPVKRLVEDGFPYLNEQQGSDGWLALEVIAVGVARP